ncbi:CPBP family intramembrane glutamic endopeptidase [Ruficoccus sp. ZRK36]|uniref:CPBP family intramembrane glutamic endopeptidase n=1 Tax=Ruficoccus sp. ZRK36 TaxID=2866311 RepID=UPI001C73BFE7|nr:CPBP family intramembrane glutamic endopeptidase [Ruficoccus sp. ZRK36]QYY35714.1 CPBP family intramembrane metalloprotease [Ruficoccus sp. ZRK36]
MQTSSTDASATPIFLSLAQSETPATAAPDAAEPVTTATTQAPEELPAEDNKSDMQSDPLMIVILFAASIYLFKLWLDDFKANKRGEPNPKAFPGATACSALCVIVAVVGALILLAVETFGEIALGVSAEQSDITWLALLSICAAAFFEELIFRGYLVVTKKGTAALVGSIFIFSFLFAALHPFVWDLEMPEGVPGWQFWQGSLSFDFGVKGWFSTALVFANSLWFYTVRFYGLNKTRSLIPCMAAHLASNVGVFVIKLVQGHVVGLY